MTFTKEDPVNIEIKNRFMAAWEEHFPGNELPLACFYSDDLGNASFPDRPKPSKKGFPCIFSQIAPVMNRPKNLIAVLVLLAASILPLHGEDQGPVATTEVFLQALGRADLNTLLDQLADDATLFAPSPDTPGRIEGHDNIAALFKPIFARLRETGEGPVYMKLVPRDLKVTLMGDSAVVIFHLGRLPDKPLHESYSFSRRTFVLRLLNGRWKIVHLHASNVLIPGNTNGPGESR